MHHEDRTIRSLSPSLTALAGFGGRNNIQAYSIAPAEILSAFAAIRPVLARQIASKAHAYGWNAWERGSVAVPTVSVCPKNLQRAADCLICWQVIASPLHPQEQDVMRSAFCLK